MNKLFPAYTLQNKKREILNKLVINPHTLPAFVITSKRLLMKCQICKSKCKLFDWNNNEKNKS